MGVAVQVVREQLGVLPHSILLRVSLLEVVEVLVTLEAMVRVVLVVLVQLATSQLQLVVMVLQVLAIVEEEVVPQVGLVVTVQVP